MEFKVTNLSASGPDNAVVNFQEVQVEGGSPFLSTYSLTLPLEEAKAYHVGDAYTMTLKKNAAKSSTPA
jgi:hypothetical protein